MNNKMFINLKKITSSVLMFLTIGLNLSFVPTAMAGVSDPTLTIGSQSALNGATINVPINASNFSSFASNVGNVNLTINYDNTLLTYVDTTFNNLPASARATHVVANEIRIAWNDTTSVTPITIPTGALVTLNFTVNSSATTNTDISFDVSTVDSSRVDNAAFSLITTNFANGVISLNPATSNPTAIDLGEAGKFAVLSKVAISSVPVSIITGDIGVSPSTGTAITGFTCPAVTGTVHVASAGGATLLCQTADPTYLTPTILEMEAAYSDALSRTSDVTMDTDLGGETLTPGVYTTAVDLGITSDVTLNCSSNPDGVFIFRIGGKLSLSASTDVVLNGCQPGNVFWAVAGTTNIGGGVGTESTFVGTVLGGPATSEITVITGSTVNGRLLGQKTIALDKNTIIIPTATAPLAHVYAQADFKAFDGVAIGTNSYTVSSGITAIYDTGTGTEGDPVKLALTGYAPIVIPWFGPTWTTYNYVTVGIKLPTGFTGTRVYDSGIMRYDVDLAGAYKMSSAGTGSTDLATAGAALGYLDYSFAANSTNTKKDGIAKLKVIWNVGDAPEYFTIDINGLQAGPVFNDKNENGTFDSGEPSFNTIQAAIDAGTTVDGDIILVNGTFGSINAYTVYNVTKPITIRGVNTGSDKAKVFGTFLIYVDGATIDNLSITNKGISHPNKNAINLLGKQVTITNNDFSLGNGTGGVANGVVIWPYGSNAVSLNITGNTFTGYSLTVPDWSSTALLIAEEINATPFTGTPMSTTLVVPNEESFANGNTYINNSYDYVHQNWNGGSKWFYSKVSNSAGLLDAIDNSTAGATILLGSNIALSVQLNVTTPVTIDGSGHTLTTTATGGSVIQITANDVTIKNLIEDGNEVTGNNRGINIYKVTGVLLDNVTASNNSKNGIVVNGSTVTVNNIVTKNNGWEGIDVDMGGGVTTLASLTVNGISVHNETKAAIRIDDTSKTPTPVVFDTNSQYTASTTATLTDYYLKTNNIETATDYHELSTGGGVTVTVDIPSGTIITGDNSWDGVISDLIADPNATVTVPGFDTTVTSAFTVGSSLSDLTFDNAARLIFTDQANTLVGWYDHANNFHEITADCATTGGDDQVAQTAQLGAGASCKMNVDNDLVVWTKHFSTFVTYTQTAVVVTPPSSNSSGGGSVGSVSSACVSVDYDEWQTTCINNLQFRNIKALNPSGCAMTLAQRDASQRACGVAGVKIDNSQTTVNNSVTPQVLGAKAYANGSLLRGTNGGIYYIVNGNKYLIKTLKELWAYRNIKTIQVSDEVLAQYANTNSPKVLGVKAYANGSLLRGNKGGIYYIVNGNKYLIKNLKELWAYRTLKTINVTDEVLAQYPSTTSPKVAGKKIVATK